MFTHIDFKLPYNDLTTTEGKQRLYQTPEGNEYPSITTVLSVLSKKAIMEWRNKVGEEEANKISYKASSRGTAVHSIIEKYINNDEDYQKGFMPNVLQSFQDIKPVLDRIDKVYMQECPLYSDRLAIAGRVDCIAEFDNVLSVIDFKTSRKPKKAEYIHNYFMQAAFYAAAFYERTNIEIKQSVILIAVDDSEPQVFKSTIHEWLPHLINAKRLFLADKI